MPGRRRLLLGAVVVWLAGSSWAQEGGTVAMRLRGFALNFTGVGYGQSGDVEIVIERWSSDTERSRLREALAETGTSGLSGVLAVWPRVGYVRAQRGGTTDLKYAREAVLADGGRRIVLATDRAGIPSDGSNPQADTHDFLVVEVRIDKDGKGEGRTAGAERLRYNKETKALELDRYGAEPVWIRDLHVSPR